MEAAARIMISASVDRAIRRWPRPQQQRWATDAAEPGRSTATMAHGCRARRNGGPSLWLPAPARGSIGGPSLRFAARICPIRGAAGQPGAVPGGQQIRGRRECGLFAGFAACPGVLSGTTGTGLPARTTRKAGNSPVSAGRGARGALRWPRAGRWLRGTGHFGSGHRNDVALMLWGGGGAGTATVGHRCGGSDIGGPLLRLRGPAEQHRCPIVAVAVAVAVGVGVGVAVAVGVAVGVGVGVGVPAWGWRPGAWRARSRGPERRAPGTGSGRAGNRVARIRAAAPGAVTFTLCAAEPRMLLPHSDSWLSSNFFPGLAWVW